MTREDYAAIDRKVRATVGDDFNYWWPEGLVTVAVRMTPNVEKVLITITSGLPVGYPDPITNPVDPPTVDGTTITRDVG